MTEFFDAALCIQAQAVNDKIVPWQEGSALPAELVTGHPSIDFEHRQLLACMTATRQICHDLRGMPTCGQCISERRILCESDLIQILGDLLTFILDHFKTEDALMRDSLLLMLDRDVCEAHKEDHAAISASIQDIVARIDPMLTVQRLRELDYLLGRWMTNHIMLHDMLLARWLEREDSPLRQGRLR
jgi:hemerythrin-like metal-binding protein